MADTSVTNEPDAAENVTKVTPPKRDRAEYMRRYRAERSNKPSELNGDKSQLADEIKSSEIKPEPELELNKPESTLVDNKSEADKYSEQVIQADAAAQRLR